MLRVKLGVPFIQGLFLLTGYVVNNNNKKVCFMHVVENCFSSMKQLGRFLLPPGWDASPMQGFHLPPT